MSLRGGCSVDPQGYQYSSPHCLMLNVLYVLKNNVCFPSKPLQPTALTPPRLGELGQCSSRVTIPFPCLLLVGKGRGATGMCSVLLLGVNPVLCCDPGQKSQWKLFLPLTCLLAFRMINGGKERVRGSGRISPSFEPAVSPGR